MSLTELSSRIESRAAVVGVVGLGMVGLPVACVFAEAGFRVIGVELKTERVAAINAGRTPMTSDEPGLPALLADVIGKRRLHATDAYAPLADADIVTINVETPVDENHVPQYAALKAACRSLGAVLKRGALVVVESTVAPGTSESVVRPLLEEASGMRAHADFYLGACPERVTPGKLLHNLRHVSRVCGGGTPETARVMVALYRAIVSADLDATDILTAELVKTTENAYRDAQIAFANEIALVCEAVGADVWRVRELVNKSPARAMHLPGAGVGGHCIPKDPWLLAYSVEGRAPLRIISAARQVNEAMPAHMVELLVEGLQALGQNIAGTRIAVLGYAYLENSDDARDSPSEAFAAHLAALDAEAVIHDPFVEGYGGDVLAKARDCDAAVLMVAHDAYRSLDLSALKKVLRVPLLIDGRHLFDAQRAHTAGLHYRCIGQAPYSSKQVNR